MGELIKYQHILDKWLTDPNANKSYIRKLLEWESVDLVKGGFYADGGEEEEE